ncbi:pre-mRNA-splicing factor 38B-like [Schistocerca serialis cubense]|uniref:pre-mRNA-splicing factor 38B-like n=1 Tax=Schistocerca serialis cubense TaxID=2023355 RepID=UPI00214E6F48|nr:pre-mRNA-splicing factor 38B-like [Schistocerca serialis cubense]
MDGQQVCNDSKLYKKSTSKEEKKNNVLQLWGNERTMNLNPLILENIRTSYYFKVNLRKLKTYHEVVDEIYYRVGHLEPWEKGSRNTTGLTALCGGVRGVGAGGIVSSAYCLLYKMFTLKMTRKQVNGLITHPDSPYIRGLGFMYIRYTQPPQDLWEWFEPFLNDKEEIDVKAGGGHVMTIGDMLKRFLTKLQWFSTFFPRIPQPIQQTIDRKLPVLTTRTRNEFRGNGTTRRNSFKEYHTAAKLEKGKTAISSNSCNSEKESSASSKKRRHSFEYNVQNTNRRAKERRCN